MNDRKILHLTGMSSTKFGEIERFLIDLINLSRRKGYRTILQYESMPLSRAYLDLLEKMETPVVVCPINTNPLMSIRNVFSIIGSHRPEIVHAHFAERFGLLAIPISGRLFRARKIIAEVHTISGGKSNKLPKLVYDRFDHVLACSEAVKRDLIGRGVNPRRIDVQYLGLSEKQPPPPGLRNQLRQEFSIPDGAIVIACIAFDAVFKGLDVLLKAFARLSRTRGELHFLSVGVDHHISKLPELARELGISAGHIHWAGIKDNGWEFLAAADIYVQPSRLEGLGLSILEAMSLKLPVVCTRVGGMVEAVIDGQSGFIAEPDDPDSLADAIERMIESRTEWPKFGQAGYEHYLKNFRAQPLREKLVDKYYP
jgi:glycosyltransferase involved in cell wall biosynthesis